MTVTHDKQSLIPEKEQETLLRKLNERFVKAFATYRLLEDDDHILVGLSGGKDSLCLLELLARRAKIFHPSFRVEAAHIRMENIHYETSADYLQDFCKNLDVPLHIITTRFDTLEQARPKPPCFLCSWNRRKQLFNLAQELGCNKIALGHHQDDLLCTCLMNLFYQGRFDTMPALLKMRKMPLSIIRPLCLIEEADISRYAAMRNYMKQVKLCPYETKSNRTEMQHLFSHIQQMAPESRSSLWNAIVRAGVLVQKS